MTGANRDQERDEVLRRMLKSSPSPYRSAAQLKAAPDDVGACRVCHGSGEAARQKPRAVCHYCGGTGRDPR